VWLDPRSWHPDLVRVRVGITVADGAFGAVRGLRATSSTRAVRRWPPSISVRRTQQNALIVGEVYLHSGG
jgi:hypothetical protein